MIIVEELEKASVTLSFASVYSFTDSTVSTMAFLVRL
jgi:hypothetical protein